MPWINYFKKEKIVIVKQGFITDTSYANIVFFDGHKWFTPVSPLLKGTKRTFLLDKKIIEETEIRIDDLEKFKKARLINAMIDFEDKVEILVENIIL